MLKAQETRIVFNAPASTPADATVTLMIWTAIEYEPGQWLDLEMIIREIFVPKLSIGERERRSLFFDFGVCRVRSARCRIYE